jgi:hypothetical protein
MAVPYKLNYFEIETGIDSTSTFIHTGDFTATKLKKYLGTSNDILLGDGTTASLSGLQSTITLTTTGTSGAATLIGATLNIPNYGGALSGYVPYTGATQALNLGTNNGILLTDTSSNSSIAITSSSTGSGAIVVNKSVNGQGVTVNNAGIGSGFYANNSSTGNGVLIGNASTGKGLVIDNAALAIGDPFVYTLGGAAFVKAKIDYLGNITGNSFVKTGGTSSQFLKADGSVDSTAYGTGSVTSVAALTLGTSGTDLSSSVANPNTTPVITLNVPTASATNRGALSSGDWTTFNGKQDTITLTTTGTSGAATFIANTLNIPQYQSVLTNPVTGTGTTNTLPKFTGASAIGDSAITDDGTTVTLVSRALSGTSASFSSTSTATAFIPTGSTVPTNGMYLSAANTLNFATNSGSRLSIASTGLATFSAGITTSSTNTFNGTGVRAIDATSTGVQFASQAATHSVIFGDKNSRLFSLFTPSGAATMSIRNHNTSTDMLTFVAAGAATFASTIAATSASFSATSQFLDNTGASTTTKFIRISNTSGDMAIGIEGSTPSQIASGSGGIAYSTVLKTVSTTALILGTNSIAALTINGSTQAASFSSSASATAFIPTASSIPTNGMYLSGTNTLDFATNSVNRLSISSAGAATFSGALTATSVNVVYNNALTNQTTDGVTLASYTTGASNELLQLSITLTNNNTTTQVRCTINYTTDNNNAVSLTAIATSPLNAFGEGQAVVVLNVKNATTLTVVSVGTAGPVNYSSRIAITKIL